MSAQRSGITELFSGLGAIAVLGGLYYFTGSRLFIFIGIFAGVLPTIRGMSKVIQSQVARKERARIEAKSVASAERTVLILARQERGRLTPAVVAVNSDLTLDTAEKELNELVDKGHAELNVTEDGRMEYLFREFLP